jgi:signal transduction histidine kinase
MTATEVSEAGAERAQAAKPSRTRSLKLRLIAISLALLAFALLATGALLVTLFRAQTQRHFNQTLHDHLEELAAAAEVDADGGLKLTWEPSDPRFKAPFSGWYWEARSGGVTVRRSPSLLDRTLPAAAPGPGRPHVYRHIPGPEGGSLRIIAQDIVLPERKQPFTILVAGPCLTVRRDVLIFMGQLAAALVLLALSLGALIAAQVTYGLRPLAQVREALADVRAGRQTRVETGGPAEVAPLIDELNGLLDEREKMVERARAEAGDLAHALKTPIAVIRNEAREIPGESGAVLAGEAGRMARVVENHLVRARTKAMQRLPPGRAALDAVMDDVRFSLSRLYPEKVLEWDVEPGAAFAGDADDLGEMIGNLADNACKWARRTARISARRLGDRIRVQIEDDGPGLDEAGRARALARGERLDSCAPGHGLGLSIAAQLAELHGGALTLAPSDAGLRAVLDLPAA